MPSSSPLRTKKPLVMSTAIPDHPSHGEPTHVYIRDAVKSWIPVLQLPTTNNNNNNNNNSNNNNNKNRPQAVVKIPDSVQRAEQDILSTLPTWPGKMDAIPGETTTIDLVDYPNHVLPMQNVDANGRLEEFPDMVQLPYLHEAAILYNLKYRHIKQKPYTRTGDIIIAVNPYCWLHHLYTEPKRMYYSHRLVWDHSYETEDPRPTMEPHVYEVSALSYRGLASDHCDQSILVSGESGAGKTETVKICLNHIASVQRGRVAADANDAEVDPVVQRVVESNPLLEAFGNAQTRRNDNSSRFGKYLQLQFRQQRTSSTDSSYHSPCALLGSKCEVYLLEKNRVVGFDDRERSFHIFYQLLNSTDDVKARVWPKLRGKTTRQFRYLTHNPQHVNSIEGQTDAQHFQHTLAALALVGVRNETLAHLLNAICVVLQLGNLGFGAGPDTDSSKITTSGELSDVAELMGVSVPNLTLALTERTILIKGGQEVHKVALNTESAEEARDALAKELYQKTFLWLVRTINDATCAPATGTYGTIGLLDIFGFEAFDVNRFEQLCINYANEKLQQKFTEDIFRNVQEEYRLEGIPFADVWYDDNTDVLDLIEGSTGLLALLNEECVRPKGNDKAFVQKALQMNKSSSCLILHRTDNLSFGIQHYAGCVMYDADMFVTRNNDTLPTDLQRCAELSANPIINQPRSDVSIRQNNNPARPLVAGQRSAPNRTNRCESNIAAPTVWTKYKSQLHALMADLRLTRSRYIRCIKPNSEKKPTLFEHQPVVDQLRCAGVVAGITISRSSFPNRLDNAVVLARYSHLWDTQAYPSKKTDRMTATEKRAADCQALLTCALRSKATIMGDRPVAAFAVGKTRTYYRAGALEYLEANRMRGLDEPATTIQRAARGWLARNMGNSAQRRDEAERERLRQEEEAYRAQLAKESAGRKAEIAAEERELLKEMERLKTRMQSNDKQTDEAMKKARAKKEEVAKEIADLEKKTDDDARRKANEPKRILSDQENILKEQRKLIEALKKENKLLRKDLDKWSEKVNGFDSVMNKLQQSTSNLENTYGNENKEFGRLSQNNETMLATINEEKTAHNELKTKVQRAQDDYMDQAGARLELQKTLAKILEKIQSNTHKERIVIEKSNKIATDVEAEAKAAMANLQAHENQPSLIFSDNSDSDLSY